MPSDETGRPDSSVEPRFGSEATTHEAELTDYGDGSTMEVFADGRVLRRHSGVVWQIAIDGTTAVDWDDATRTVVHSDGTRTEIDSNGGRHEFDAGGAPTGLPRERSEELDGSFRTVTASGAEIVTHLDGDRTVTLPDGSARRHTTGGAIERPCRSAVWTIALDGTTTIERDDGSSTLIHPDGSRSDVSVEGEVVEYPSEVRAGVAYDTGWDEHLEGGPRQLPLPLLGAALALVVLALVGLALLLDSGPPIEVQELDIEELADVPSENQERYCEAVLALGDELATLDALIFGAGSPAEADSSFDAVLDEMESAAELAGAVGQPTWADHAAVMADYRDAYAAAGHDLVTYELAVTEESAEETARAMAFARDERDSCLEFTLLKGSDDQAED